MNIWKRIGAWLDNPIFVKHVRSRLRVQAVASAIVAVQALCLCIAWAGFQLKGFDNGIAFAWLLFLQVIIIVAIGGAQVATSVGSGRASGILDFHRVSPLSRDALSLGFFFGAPIREYLLLATTLPYSCALRGVWSSECAWAGPVDDCARRNGLALSRIGALERSAGKAAVRLAWGGGKHRFSFHLCLVDRWWICHSCRYSR